VAHIALKKPLICNNAVPAFYFPFTLALLVGQQRMNPAQKIYSNYPQMFSLLRPGPDWSNFLKNGETPSLCKHFSVVSITSHRSAVSVTYWCNSGDCWPAGILLNTCRLQPCPVPTDIFAHSHRC